MTINEGPEETHPKVAPRWPTRMFATECIRKIIAVCENNRAHFDLALARVLREESSDGTFIYPDIPIRTRSIKIEFWLPGGSYSPYGYSTYIFI